MTKRAFDIVMAASGLLLAAPVLLLAAVAIQMDSRGPVFYRAVRAGLHGRPFRMFKFRTMVANADRIGGSSTADGDPRVTHVGRFLRKHKLDELPQLFNVITGDMSLVGPRPEVFEYVNMFTEEEREILSVRPGITDWATLWNPDEGRVLAGADDPDRVYLEEIRPAKIRWQLEYVRRRSFATDLKILAQTVCAVVRPVRPRALEAVTERRQGS